MSEKRYIEKCGDIDDGYDVRAENGDDIWYAAEGVEQSEAVYIALRPHYEAVCEAAKRCREVATNDDKKWEIWYHLNKMIGALDELEERRREIEEEMREDGKA